MEKWLRNYRAEFEIGEKINEEFIPHHNLVITPPFTLQLHVSSGVTSEQNRGIFQFINLSETDRADLYIDIWNFQKKYIYMKLYAGYGETMPLIFEGLVRRCTSGKQGGSTEFITTIEAFDQGHFLTNSFLNATYTKGTRLSDILKVACEGTTLTPGYISPDIEPLKRDRTFIGQPADLISREYSGYDFFVNRGEINLIGERDLLPGEVQVITDESGLIGSPDRGEDFVRCTTTFEPQLRAAQGVLVQSLSLPWFNQAYKIVQIEHRGIISPVVCGQLITELTLTALDDNSRELEKTLQTSYTAQPTPGVWKKPVQGQISSRFGPRPQPIPGASTNHMGIDIAAPFNTTVYAPANGRVITAGWVSGFGKAIYIDHGKINNKTVVSIYGHLNNYIVRPQQFVEQGQAIGYVGSTGYSTGPHLHFQINENNHPVDPTKYIGNYG